MDLSILYTGFMPNELSKFVAVRGKVTGISNGLLGTNDEQIALTFPSLLLNKFHKNSVMDKTPMQT